MIATVLSIETALAYIPWVEEFVVEAKDTIGRRILQDLTREFLAQSFQSRRQGNFWRRQGPFSQTRRFDWKLFRVRSYWIQHGIQYDPIRIWRHSMRFLLAAQHSV
jgi:hypothetical protein